jgi:hypothetical protein
VHCQQSHTGEACPGLEPGAAIQALLPGVIEQLLVALETILPFDRVATGLAV